MFCILSLHQYLRPGYLPNLSYREMSLLSSTVFNTILTRGIKQSSSPLSTCLEIRHPGSRALDPTPDFIGPFCRISPRRGEDGSTGPKLARHPTPNQVQRHGLKKKASPHCSKKSGVTRPCAH